MNKVHGGRIVVGEDAQETHPPPPFFLFFPLPRAQKFEHAALLVNITVTTTCAVVHTLYGTCVRACLSACRLAADTEIGCMYSSPPLVARSPTPFPTPQQQTHTHTHTHAVAYHERMSVVKVLESKSECVQYKHKMLPALPSLPACLLCLPACLPALPCPPIQRALPPPSNPPSTTPPPHSPPQHPAAQAPGGALPAPYRPLPPRRPLHTQWAIHPRRRRLGGLLHAQLQRPRNPSNGLWLGAQPAQRRAAVGASVRVGMYGVCVYACVCAAHRLPLPTAVCVCVCVWRVESACGVGSRAYPSTTPPQGRRPGQEAAPGAAPCVAAAAERAPPHLPDPGGRRVQWGG
jgi:hypothetical protein